MLDSAKEYGTRSTGPKSKSRRHVLCVDDDKPLVHLTAQILAIHGYRVTALCNPLEAAEVFNRENIELAILDYQMPEMNGTCLAAQLKRVSSGVKVVLFTGTLQLPASELLPVDAVVNKSDGIQVLVATVNDFFDAR